VVDTLADLFSEHDLGSSRLFGVLSDPKVSQIVLNRHDRLFYTDDTGVHTINQLFAGSEQYINFVNQLMRLTDVGHSDLRAVKASVVEGSFNPTLTDLHGSVHICTTEITRGDPVVTIRKQPRSIVTLDQMVDQGMMTTEMRNFLELATRGRLNILVSGGSGAGKTTLARALSQYIDPHQRVLTLEEIDELHLNDRLPNVVALTTYREHDDMGRLVREETLSDLAREALRMRPDRIWVGETRGREAYALVKACNSGHDGSITTIHADNGQQAVKQLVSYVMEAGVPEEPARDQVARAFHLGVQLTKARMGRRVVSEITELEPVREGGEQRRVELYGYDHETDTFYRSGMPTPRLRADLERHGVNLGL
jgi:pilus assembly protein CpaF